MWYASPMTRMADIDRLMGALDLPEVYRVGGSVRDELLHRKPKDADYVVRGADLEKLGVEARKLGKVTPLKLRDGRIVGARVAPRGHGLIDIALPRTEVSTGPGRQDFEIVTDPALPLFADAERRDFRFNALYRDVRTGGVMDPLGFGLWDLDHGYVNTTHRDSFRDDPLRILRALRFVSVLPGFDLTSATINEMKRHADAVTGLTQKGVSGTALDELCKLLMGTRPNVALAHGRDTGALGVLLPELVPSFGFDQGSRYHDMTTDEHTFEALRVAAALGLSLRVRMALLFHDSGKPEAAWIGEDGRKHYYSKVMQRAPDGVVEVETEDHEVVGARNARAALTRLNAPRALRENVCTLIERHMLDIGGKTKPVKVRRWRSELGDALLEDLIKHRMADCMGKGEINYDHLKALARLEKIREDAVDQGVPVSVKQLKIKGGEIAALGIAGRAIGDIQRQLLHEVMSDPSRNDRDWLITRAQKLKAYGVPGAA